ncbi:MAG: NAD(P)/FAD-dependent oxidoreductase [Methanophagales archaeon ANME-1-THS]|nr:MAG: NAD(P)/FAD-dependent oxidoreductase [Methanophagales archaeon ANME-1-THS]
MEEERHDVVVVGAGPAGSLTAKKAAAQGLDVLLIERNQEIGVPVKCAEGVNRAIEQFVVPDKRWISAEVKGANIYAPDGTKVVLSGSKMEEVGYVLERRLFDKFLAHEAARAGAEIRLKTEACGIIEADGYARGVYARSMGQTTRIYADAVIGADGVESRVGRWMGINTRLRPSELSICAEFLMCDIDLNNEYSEFFLGNTIAPKGYAWIFPKGDDSANVGLGIGGDVSGEKHRAIDYLRAFVHERFPAGKVIAEMYGAVPLSGPIRESVANGLILVGDAARHVNPLTGGGIIYAMQAGEIAGDVVAQAVHEHDLSKQRLMEYETRWKKEFGKRLDTGLKAKHFLFNLSDDDLNTLAHSLQGVEIKELSTWALLTELMQRNPRLLFGLAKLLL